MDFRHIDGIQVFDNEYEIIEVNVNVSAKVEDEVQTLFEDKVFLRFLSPSLR